MYQRAAGEGRGAGDEIPDYEHAFKRSWFAPVRIERSSGRTTGLVTRTSHCAWPSALSTRTTMAHKPNYPNNDVPEEFEPGAPPVEPDEGPVPDFIPQDPEHERLVDPAAK